MRPLALVLLICACNATHVGAGPAPEERLLELAAPSFTGAVIAWSPVRASPATPDESSAMAMAMALPLHAGDRFTALDVSCAARDATTPIEFRIYRTGAQGAETFTTHVAPSVTTAWAEHSIQDPHNLEKGEALSLRVSAFAPIACSNVTVRYEPWAP
jgi:hypothetical protein